MAAQVTCRQHASGAFAISHLPVRYDRSSLLSLRRCVNAGDKQPLQAMVASLKRKAGGGGSGASAVATVAAGEKKQKKNKRKTVQQA